MKKIFFALLMLLSSLAFSQETKPTGILFQRLPTYQIFYNQADSLPWLFKGNDLGWNSFITRPYLNTRLDSLGKTVWFKVKRDVNFITRIDTLHRKDTLDLSPLRLIGDTTRMIGTPTIHDVFRSDTIFRVPVYTGQKTFRASDIYNNAVGIHIKGTNPTAKLHIAAGSATASTAPLKLTSGTNLTTPEAGAIEYDGTHLYFTPGSVRRILKLQDDSLKLFRQKGDTINNTGTATVYQNSLKIPLTQKASANGVATLDAGGKVPVSQLPSSLLIYQGVWNPVSNIPTLQDGTGTSGFVYMASTPGTCYLGGKLTYFYAKDYVIYNGSTWEKSGGTDAVTSVNGLQGVVVLNTDSVHEGFVNKYFTDARVAGKLDTTKATTLMRSHWTTGYDDRLKWDGGSTGLVAATGRTSLGLGTAATSATGDFAPATESANYIWNQYSVAQSANMSISGDIYLSRPTTGSVNIYSAYSANGGGIMLQNADNVVTHQTFGSSGNYFATGKIQGSTFQSTVGSGAVPLIVASTTMVDNLNVQLWNGHTNGLSGTAKSTSPDAIAGLSGTAVYPYNSTGIKTFLGLTNATTGTGTENYIPKFTTTGSTIGNSSFFTDADGNFFMPDRTGAAGYIIVNKGAEYTGALRMQAGYGSAGAGGAVNLYGASHATHPGDVAIGISATSGAKFRINISGMDGGTDILTAQRDGTVGVGVGNPLQRFVSIGSILNVGATNNNGISYTNYNNGVYSATHEVAPTEGVGIWSDNQGNASVGSLYNNVSSSLNLVVRGSSTGNGLIGMRILGNGNSGFGTLGPTSKVSIRSALAVVGGITLDAINTGTGTNNYGADIESTGAGANNIALYLAAANGSEQNRALYIESGYPIAGANNYAIHSASVAKSYFAGPIGIGYSDPYGRIEVHQSTTYDGIYISSSTTARNSIALYNNGSAGIIEATYLGGGGAYTPITLWTGGTERVRITTDGNFAIGTTDSGTSKLYVNGNAGFAHSIDVSGVNGGTSNFWGALTVQNNKATTLTGTLSVAGQTTSTVANGTKPFVITSATMNDNLNADMVDGLHAADFAPASGGANYIKNQIASAQTANFWVNGDGRADRLSATGGILDFDNKTGSNYLQLSSGVITLYQGGSAGLSQKGTHIGVGDMNPGVKLAVSDAEVYNWMASFTKATTYGHTLYMGYDNNLTTRYGLYIVGGGGDIYSKDILVGSNKFVVRGDGYVGIGIDPAAPLHVSNASSGFSAYFQNTGSGQGIGIYNADYDAGDFIINSSNGGGYVFQVNGQGNIRISSSQNVDNSLTFNPYTTGLGTNYAWNLTATNSGNSYKFQIRENATPYVTINNSAGANAGFFGIGTVVPEGKLEVYANSDVYSYITTAGINNAAISWIRSGNGTISGRYAYTLYQTLETTPQRWNAGMIASKNYQVQDATNATSPIIIEPGATTNLLYLKGSCIGININNPLYNMHVDGTAFVSTSITTPTINLTTGATIGYYWKCNNATTGAGAWAAISSSQFYNGAWDASINTPTLADGTGTQGSYYHCTVSGTVNFGHGAIPFTAYSDDVAYNGTIWQKIPNAQYQLVTMTASVIGGAILGSGMNIGGEGTDKLNILNEDKGDISVSGSGTLYGRTWTIDNGVVTLAKMVDMATASLIYRRSAGTGIPEVNTLATLKVDLAFTKSDVGLGNVENTALSTWAGSINITTLGTIGTGTWNATSIADGKIASALTGKTYNGLTLTTQTIGFTIAGGGTSKTLTVGADANVSGTNTGDNASNSLYSGLVSNATHTGDAEGSTSLVVKRINGVALSGLSTGILKNTTSTGIPSIAVAADYPTLNQSTTGTAAGLTAQYIDWSASSGGASIANKPTMTTIGLNMLGLSNPGAITYPQFNANNTITPLTAAQLKSAIGAGSGNGSVTSVAMSVPTGLTISGSPITSSGTLTVTLTADYVIPTTTNISHGETAYDWGNHANAGYITGISKSDVESVLTGAITSHSHAYLPLSGGTLTGALSGTTASFTSTVSGSDFCPSDSTLKRNIMPIGDLSKFDQVKFYTATYKSDPTNRLRYTVMAQDIEKFAPELVYTDEKGKKAVNYIDLLVAEIALMREKITMLESKLNNLQP